MKYEAWELAEALANLLCETKQAPDPRESKAHPGEIKMIPLTDEQIENIVSAHIDATRSA